MNSNAGSEVNLMQKRKRNRQRETEREIEKEIYGSAIYAKSTTHWKQR